MTDIETLRQAVIDAARDTLESAKQGNGSWDSIEASLAALEAAMRPDPWALLEQARAALEEWRTLASVDSGEEYKEPLLEPIDAALAWRKEHPDD